MIRNDTNNVNRKLHSFMRYDLSTQSYYVYLVHIYVGRIDWFVFYISNLNSLKCNSNCISLSYDITKFVH